MKLTWRTRLGVVERRSRHFRGRRRGRVDALRFPLPENEGHIPAGVDLAAPVRDPQWDALEKLIREELPLMGPNALLSP